MQKQRMQTSKKKQTERVTKKQSSSHNLQSLRVMHYLFFLFITEITLTNGLDAEEIEKFKISIEGFKELITTGTDIDVDVVSGLQDMVRDIYNKVTSTTSLYQDAYDKNMKSVNDDKKKIMIMNKQMKKTIMMMIIMMIKMINKINFYKIL